jgi:L-alanine-DL-glutamate epimerase-like enolase superfamily enzyme
VEPHSYGSTLVQAAHLHHILAARNCEYFEVPHPKEKLDFGMKTVIETDKDGFVHAPTAPGLGYEVDWNAIDASTIQEFK